MKGSHLLVVQNLLPNTYFTYLCKATKLLDFLFTRISIPEFAHPGKRSFSRGKKTSYLYTDSNKMLVRSAYDAESG